jgi:hypothetical protein
LNATWNKKAKPHFVATWLGVKDLGYSAKELVARFMEAFGEKVRPYLVQFVRDIRDNNLEIEGPLPNYYLTEQSQGNTIEGQGGGANANRQEQGDLSRTVREDGKAVENDSTRALG